MYTNKIERNLIIISAKACTLAEQGFNDDAKMLEKLLSDLYEVLYSSTSNIYKLKPNNPDYDFEIDRHYFQVTIRKDTKKKIESFKKGITEKRKNKYINAVDFTLIFFRNKQGNDNEIIKKYKGFKILFLNDIIKEFSDLNNQKVYDKIIQKYYSIMLCFEDDQRGPSINDFDYIDRTIEIEKKSGEPTTLHIEEDPYKLLDLSFLDGGNIVLHGDPASGKTSLLKDLYHKCRENKIFPLYFSLRDFDSSFFTSKTEEVIWLSNSFIFLDASDEVEERFEKEFFRKIHTLFLKYKGRIIISVRTSHLEKLIESLDDTVYNICHLSLLKKEELLHEAKKVLEEKNYNHFEDELEDYKFEYLLSNPFYFTEYLNLLKKDVVAKSPAELIKIIIKTSVDRDLKKNGIFDTNLFIKVEDLLAERAFSVVISNNNFFEIESDCFIDLLKHISLVCFSNGSFSFIHNIFKEFLCAKYLANLNTKTIIKHISLSIDKKLWLKPSFYNVIPFLLELNGDDKLKEIVISNFAESLVCNSKLMLNDAEAKKIINSILSEINDENRWLRNEFYNSVDNVRNIVTNDYIRENVAYYIDAKFCRTTIITALQMLYISPPLSALLINNVYDKIMSLINDEKYINDGYFVQQCLELVLSIKLDLLEKEKIINSYVNSASIEVRYALVNAIYKNDISDDYVNFLNDIVHNKYPFDLSYFLGLRTSECIKSFKKQESYVYFLDYYNLKVKNGCENHIYDLDKCLNGILKFDFLTGDLITSIGNLFLFLEDFRGKESLIKIINKFGLSRVVFDIVLKNNFDLLFDKKFVLEIFTIDICDDFLRMCNQYPYLLSFIPEILRSAEQNDKVLYEYLSTYIKKNKKSFSMKPSKTEVIRQKYIRTIFEEDGIKKAIKFLYSVLKVKKITVDDIFGLKKYELLRAFSFNLKTLIKENPLLCDYSTIDNFDFSKINQFIFILDVFNNIGLNYLPEEKSDYFRENITNYLSNEWYYSSEDAHANMSHQLTIILSIIARLNFNLDDQIYLKISMIPFNVMGSAKNEFLNYFFGTFSKERYVEIRKDLLIKNKLTPFEISDYLEFLLEHDISYYKDDISYYLISSLDKPFLFDAKSIRISCLNYLQHMGTIEKLCEKIDVLSYDLKIDILSYLKGHYKKEFAQLVSLKNIQDNDLPLFISSGRKDCLKKYIRNNKKIGFKDDNWVINFEFFDISDIRLIIKFFKLISVKKSANRDRSQDIVVKYLYKCSTSLENIKKLIYVIKKSLLNKRVINTQFYYSLEQEIIKRFLMGSSQR